MRIRINLDHILSKKNMSQHELSRLTGIRQASINEMCRNQTIRLPLPNLAKICEVLSCEISDILELEKEQSE
ncbi:helix-turn-helix domain-containing protein [Gracilibacillus marinus]|uniref:Helix-turn-helix domain-containing protein n=1 Tax=Gracilibacillus marinus TaxID=630535 RepID=A0ABV8VXA8_9BACI